VKKVKLMLGFVRGDSANPASCAAHLDEHVRDRLYREAVVPHSPGSRSAPWGEERRKIIVYPGGVVQPLRGREEMITVVSSPQGALRDPGLGSLTPSV
jgi:hypothetical protein